MAKCASCGRQLGTFRDPFAKLKEMNKHKRKGEMWECDCGSKFDPNDIDGKSIWDLLDDMSDNYDKRKIWYD